MVKPTVLYGYPQDPEAFEEYYANTHLPLAAKIPNVQRFEAGRVAAADDGKPPLPPHRRAVVRERAPAAGEPRFPGGQRRGGGHPELRDGRGHDVRLRSRGLGGTPISSGGPGHPRSGPLPYRYSLSNSRRH